MKNIIALYTVFFVVFSCAWAFAADVQFKKYTDEKFDFSVEYPDIYNTAEDPYVDGDGLSNFTASEQSDEGSGKYAFNVTGGKKPKGADGNSLLKEATNMEEDDYGYAYGVEPIEGTAKSGVDFYTLDYLDDSAGPEEITHVYCAVGKNDFVKYWIRYPKEEAEQYKEITARMDKSLKLK
jgi:hypothetical protein